MEKSLGAAQTEAEKSVEEANIKARIVVERAKKVVDKIKTKREEILDHYQRSK